MVQVDLVNQYNYASLSRVQVNDSAFFRSLQPVEGAANKVIESVTDKTK